MCIRLLTLIFLPAFLQANDFKIGLALSGGGARGIAHIGAIIALEEEKIPIDLVAGTSMGSIVGGLYASGYSGQEMRELVAEIDWQNIFSERPASSAIHLSDTLGIADPCLSLWFKPWEISFPTGLINAQQVTELLFQLTAEANYRAKMNFDSLRVPFRSVAVDITDGNLVVLGKGSLSEAMHASMAIPLIFDPARLKEQLLVDGGVLEVLPTRVVRDMGADLIIAVELEKMADLGTPPKNILDIGMHTFAIMINEMKQEQLRLADVLILPPLGDHDTMTYSGLDSLIRLGYEATMEKIDEIKALIPEHQIHDHARIPSAQKVLSDATIAFVRTRGNELFQDNQILSRFTIKAGQQYEMNHVLEGIQSIYALGVFNNVWVELEPLPDSRVGLYIHVIEKEIRSIDFCALYNEEYDFTGFVQGIRYNLLGHGERLTALFQASQYHRQIQFDLLKRQLFRTPLLLRSKLYYKQFEPHLYDTQGNIFTSLNYSIAGAEFLAGFEPYTKFLMTVGARYERIWYQDDVYNYIIPHARLTFDSRKQCPMCEKGAYFHITYDKSIYDHAENHRLGRWQAEFRTHMSPFAGHVWQLNAHLGLAEHELPLFYKFRKGGPLLFPGLHRHEMVADHYVSLGGMIRQKIISRIHAAIHFSRGNGFSSDKDIRFDRMINGYALGLVIDLPVGVLSGFYSRNAQDRDLWTLSFAQGL